MYIFKPRDGGSGTSNDGNTACRAFEDPEFFASECDVPVFLACGLHYIWIALAANDFKICPKKFHDYCQQIKAIYMENCHWYPPNATLHKVHCCYLNFFLNFKKITTSFLTNVTK